MPPKVRYTKEQIVQTAFEMVRQHGEAYLSARNLASRLGTSTAPIFTAFEGIDQLRDQVVRRAIALYGEYIKKGLEGEIPFKGAGLMYIKFAKDEPNLFKMLFMSGNNSQEVSSYFPEYDENEPVVRGTVEQTYGLSTEKAKKLYNHLSVYVHGIAVMYALGGGYFSDDDVSNMLTEMFKSLINGGAL